MSSRIQSAAIGLLAGFGGLVRRLRADRSGLSAIEFALIAPLMLTCLVGSVEVSNGMLASRKVTQTTSTIADLVSQATAVTNNDIADVFAAGLAVMQPIDASAMRMRITCIEADINGVTRVAWSDGRNMPPRGVGTAITVPGGIVPPGGGLIFAEIELNYVSNFGRFLTEGITITDRFYLRPRRSVTVTRIS
ncbi:MAG: pilus assembly protein [Alphaproteobacteria bacterium]|nr:pilus assembly protein [Alphaproteobacteria bacterium]